MKCRSVVIALLSFAIPCQVAAEAQCNWPYELVCGMDCCPNPDFNPEYPQFCFSIPPTVNLGVNPHWVTDPSVLSMALTANLRWVRVDLNWEVVEATKGVYDWTITDQLVRSFSNAGFSILGLIYRTPSWASKNGRSNGPPKDAEAVQRWRDFVRAIVARYPQIRHWEPWNEPNLSVFFEGTFDEYFSSILRPAAEEIRTQCAGCAVVGPTLSDTVSSATRWRIGEFFDNLGGRGGGQLIDIVSINHYSGSELAQLISAWQSRFSEMDRNGFAGKPVWITETGCGTSEGCQSLHLLRMIAFMNDTPRIADLFVYEMQSEAPFGIIGPNAVPRQAYYTLRDISQPRCVPPGYPW